MKRSYCHNAKVVKNKGQALYGKSYPLNYPYLCTQCGMCLTEEETDFDKWHDENED